MAHTGSMRECIDEPLANGLTVFLCAWRASVFLRESGIGLVRYPVDQGVDPNDSPQVPEEVEEPDDPYLVVIYNDDVTPMDYVFKLLFAYLPV
ncbi:ATP-dependent Clp protease adaptor ClpS [Marinobacter xestospongiae]|uniref:ATP-dependent Clp protease adaptor ClpS n=1 Tax=Marinobacter xestospongiae TaxID=994319 RepID=UPI0029350380|nr:ATP-dependent Clp protease adaptor ClpS [Marinobacter xestospongiae]